MIVNPPRSPQIQAIKAAGGSARALDWVLAGMPTPTVEDLGPTRESLLRQLVEQGIEHDFAARMADQAVAEGQVAKDPGLPGEDLRGGQERAEEEAVGLAVATIGSRLRVEDMLVHAVGERSHLYGG